MVETAPRVCAQLLLSSNALVDHVRAGLQTHRGDILFLDTLISENTNPGRRMKHVIITDEKNFSDAYESFYAFGAMTIIVLIREDLEYEVKLPKKERIERFNFKVESGKTTEHLQSLGAFILNVLNLEPRNETDIQNLPPTLPLSYHPPEL